MAVMAEFLMRGYNAAIPEVDIGDDILVVTDSNRLYNLGNLNQQRTLSLYCSYGDNTVTCSGQDLTNHLNNWSDWPLLKHQM